MRAFINAVVTGLILGAFLAAAYYIGSKGGVL